MKQYKAIIDGEGKTGEVRILGLLNFASFDSLTSRFNVETYPTMHHEWMGARAKLSDADNAREYTRGYNQISGFFLKYLFIICSGFIGAL